MSVLRFSKLWKMTSSIQLKKYFSSGKEDNICFQNNVKHNVKKKDEIYKLCIKHGLSTDVISANEWIFNMNSSK